MNGRKSYFRFRSFTATAFVLWAAPALAIEPATPLSDKTLEPWTATLWMRDTNGQVEHQCGASVIDPWWVLTARHCVAALCQGNISGEAEVRVGYQLDKVRSFPIKGIICAPGSCEKDGVPAHCEKPSDVPWLDDIALIHIGEVFGTAKTPSLGTLPLPAQGGAQHLLVAVGWSEKDGQDDKSKPRPSAQTIELNQLPTSRCEQLLKDPLECGESLSLGPTQFCAWSPPPQPTTFYGLQKGDSGGPLVEKTSGRPKVVGVASAACPKSGVTIFEDVSKYRDWIIKTVCGHYSGAKAVQDCRSRLQGSAMLKTTAK